MTTASRSFSPILALFLVLSAACGDDDTRGGVDAGRDSGPRADAAELDAPPDLDAGPDDAGADDAGPMDASPGDAGDETDGAAADAEPPTDGATADADLPLDADLPDAALPDADLPDAAPADGGPPAGMCFSNADCAATHYCAYPSSGSGDYSCSAPGVCMMRPDFCAAIFDPVCGCDGTTYSNACYAASAGVRPQSGGSCP